MALLKFQLTQKTKRLQADLLTPVSIYLKLRDRFKNCILLESSEYNSKENSKTFICFDPIAGFSIANNTFKINILGDVVLAEKVNKGKSQLSNLVAQFNEQFQLQAEDSGMMAGMFGYSTFDAVQFMEDIEFENLPGNDEIPLLDYRLYRFMLMIDHFKNEMFLIENVLNHQDSALGFEQIEAYINHDHTPTFGFQTTGSEQASLSDEEFLTMLKQARNHCFFGDVFQMVVARSFSQSFQGDDFNVYRALRALNPSPYLFYFDYGSFRLMGSSPEAQLTIQNNKASIYPIAGTFLRTGNLQTDHLRAQELKTDRKENAEHIMLVDLARNDLNKHCHNVRVEQFSEVQFYSHVIHLVSKVSGELPIETQPFDLMADTFPAGTLSGAPKYKALQLINQIEKNKRGFYGGAIGFIGFDHTMNQAIMIRSALSKNGKLRYAAGAGVVTLSHLESELQEVNNKLAAMRSAINKAIHI